MTTPPPPRKPEPTLPGFRTPTDSRMVWFSRTGCVVWHASGRRDVLVGGVAIGSFEKGESATRNVLLVQLAREGSFVLEDLAHAFGVTSETLRLLRRAYETGGYEALVKRKRGRPGKWKVTPAVKKRVEQYFAKGLNVPQTRRELKGLLSLPTLRAMQKAWKEAQDQAAAPPRQAELLPVVMEETEAEPTTTPPEPTRSEEQAAPGAAVQGALSAKRQESGYSVGFDLPAVSVGVDQRRLETAGPVSNKQVQFLGAWLLIAMTARLTITAPA
jgi:hypothetical protein